MTDSALIFTVDVESDWGTQGTAGIELVLPRLLSLLEEHSARATFFVVGNLCSKVGAHLPPSGPHEVASHGLTHTLLTRVEPEQVKIEVEESKRMLEAEGHRVSGFRAPFLKNPRNLPSLLEGAGYEYVSSRGSVYPSPSNLFLWGKVHKKTSSLYSLRTCTLKDGCTPFSLTYLRLYHPFGFYLLPRKTALFYCHLHEFLEDSEGWHTLSKPMKKLHTRNTGETAWSLLHRLLNNRWERVISCRDYLEELT